MNSKLVGIALAVALTAGSAAPAAAKAPAEFYGVTPQTKIGKRDFKLMDRANVGTLRINLSWGDLETPPLGEQQTERPYRWWVIDPIIYLAAKHRIRVLPTVFGTPHWLGVLQGCPTGCYKLGPNTIPAYVSFAQFVHAAVERYGRGGDFWKQHPRLPYKPIKAWQIWNEQNSSDFWKPRPSVKDYANLVIAGGSAAHAADPRAKVVLGGMIGEPGQAGKKTIAGWDFLRRLYANRDARKSFDGIAIHPYAASLASIKRTVWRWRKEMRRARALREQIWVTEIGWASGGGKHPLNRGLNGQADLITESFEWFTRKRKELRFANVDYYAWRDAAPGADHCQWCAKSGLVRYDKFQRKPAWRAFTAFTKR